MGLPSIFLSIDTGKRDRSGKTFNCPGDGTSANPFQLDYEAIQWDTGLEPDEERQMLCQMEPEDQQKLRYLDEVSADEIPDNYFESNEHLCIQKLPTNIKRIGNNAFAMCTNLNITEWPTSLQTIGYQAFEATAVVELSFPEKLKHICGRAFAKCTTLTSVTFHSKSTIQKINANVFLECTKLRIVTWPDKLKLIGAFAFKSTAVEKLDFPTSLTEILTHAFDGCAKLTTVELPGTIERITSNAFQNCTTLTTVKFTDKGNLRVRTEIHHDVFTGCTMLNGKIQLPFFTQIVEDNVGTPATEFSGVNGLEVEVLKQEPIPKTTCCAQTLRKHIVGVNMGTAEPDDLFVNKMAAYFATKFVLAVSPCYDQRYNGKDYAQIQNLHKLISAPDKHETMIQMEMFLLSEAEWKLPCGVYQECTDTSKPPSIDQIYTSVLDDLTRNPKKKPSSTTVTKKPLPEIHTKSPTMQLTGCSPTTTTTTTPAIYKYSDKLGRGQYGDIEQFVNTTKPEDKVAIKWIKCDAYHGDIEAGITVDVVKEVIIGNYIDSDHVVKPKCAYLAKRYDPDDIKRPGRPWVYYVGLVMDVATSDLREFTEELKTWEQELTNRPFGWEPRQKIMRCVLEGLKAMHNKGLAHSDLKPDQILITYDEANPVNVTKVAIGDLGSVQFTGTEQHPSNSSKFYGEKVTTHWYIAPETMLFSNYGNKCDMWAAGLVFSELYLGTQGIIFEEIDSSINKPKTDWLPGFSANVLDFKGWHDYWETNYERTDESRFEKTNWLTEENLDELKTEIIQEKDQQFIPTIKERLESMQTIKSEGLDRTIIIKGEWLVLAFKAGLQAVDVIEYMNTELQVICGLLVADPSKRLSAEDALKQLTPSPTQGSRSTADL